MKQLEYKIADNLDAIAQAYNIKNKMLYKQCIFALELDLAEYEHTYQKPHPANQNVIKLYEKLWEM